MNLHRDTATQLRARKVRPAAAAAASRRLESTLPATPQRAGAPQADCFIRSCVSERCRLCTASSVESLRTCVQDPEDCRLREPKRAHVVSRVRTELS